MRKRGSVGVGRMSHKLQARWPSVLDLVTGAMFGAQRDVASTQFVRDKNKRNAHGCDTLWVGQVLKFKDYLSMTYLQATPAHDPAISSMDSGVVRSNKFRFQKQPILVVNWKHTQVYKTIN